MIQTVKLKLLLRIYNSANVCSAGFYCTCIPDGEKVTSGRKEAEAILITSTSLTVEKWKWATQNSSQQSLEAVPDVLLNVEKNTCNVVRPVVNNWTNIYQ